MQRPTYVSLTYCSRSSTPNLAQNKKQLKLIPFPNVYVDDDVPMSEAEPLYPEFHHSRAPSDVSSTTSNESNSPLTSSRMLAPIPFNSFLTGPAVAAAYPTFDLYPLPFFTPEGSVNTNSHNYRHYSAQSPTPMVGLLQPSSSFSHHG
ncbi:hypothetical protein L208DRAFT_1400874 [Tricholoma matsutake]|nr:hypothetical protein L208DRAFT_1400874 [Tricholoma matsutake 945]